MSISLSYVSVNLFLALNLLFQSSGNNNQNASLFAFALQDGLALRPPMGWRSWNLYGTNVDQKLMIKIMEGLVQKRGSQQVSLCDLGFCHIGLDDNWHKIKTFPNEMCTYHDESGYPMVNTDRFPDLKEMTDHGHKLGLTVGWYFNNCYQCHEKCPASQDIMEDPLYPFTSRVTVRPPSWNPRIFLQERSGTAHERCYKGDVRALFDYGFDGVKLDSCGWQMDLDLWHKLMSEEYQNRRRGSIIQNNNDIIIQQHEALPSGPTKPMLVEACHWGETKPDKPDYALDENNQIVDTAWCPFHFWRTSGDIMASFGSFMAILQHTFSESNGLSRPGCWGHLDMLEVGCKGGPNGIQDVGLSFVETRTHFAAWAIMSSPLFLSHDVTNETIMDEVWPIISNTDIIDINQAWAGYSGGPFWKSRERIPFRFRDKPLLRPNIHKGLYLYKPLERIVDDSLPTEERRYNRVAVLMINSGPAPTDFTLNLNTVPGLECASIIENSNTDEMTDDVTVECEIRDVWEQRTLGIFRDDTLVVENVTSHDSAFFIIGRPHPPKDETSFLNPLDYVQINEASLSSDTPILLLISIMASLLAILRYRRQTGRRQKKTIQGRLRR